MRIVLCSVDFHEIAGLQHAGEWRLAGELLAEVARRLERAGADVLVLCTNTMHKVADIIQAAVAIPLLHIADPTVDELRRAGVATVGLLATRFTMEQDLYRDRIGARGIRVITPDEVDRATVHRIIYEELCVGRIEADSRATYCRIIRDLQARGAQAVILGCTEIMLLIGPQDVGLPVFDTTFIHARTAADWSLAG